MARLLESGADRLVEDGTLRLLESDGLVPQSDEAVFVLLANNWRFSLPDEQWQMEPET